MADKIKSPKMGVCYRVENKGAKNNEKKSYIALNVEDENGKNERWLLMTEMEYERIFLFEESGVFNGMKKGRLVPFNSLDGFKRAFLGVFIGTDGKTRAARLPERYLKTWEARARRNPEDLPKKGFLEDLLD